MQWLPLERQRQKGGVMFKFIWEYLRDHVCVAVISLIISLIPSAYLTGILMQAAASFNSQYKVKVFSIANFRYGWASKEIMIPMAFLFALVIVALATYASGYAERDDDEGYMRSSAGTSGTAGLMSEREMSKVLKLAAVKDTKNEILGMKRGQCISYEPKSKINMLNKNTAICATSGSGKTRGQVIPRIFQIIRRGESFIATDPKGEVFAETAALAEKYGYTVRILNCKDSNVSDGCDFFSIFNYEIGDTIETIQKLTKIIVLNTATKTDFWSEMAEKLLQICMIRVIDGEELANGRTLRSLYDLMMMQTDQMIRTLKEIGPNHPAYIMIEDFEGATATIKDSARSGATTLLRVLMSEAVTKMVTHDDIDFGLPGKQKCAYYVCTSDQDSSKNWIAALFYGCLFLALVEGTADRSDNRTLDVPVNMIFDEFPNIAKIPEFQKKLATIRSRNISATIIFQNIPQMQHTFPDDWLSILEACDMNIFIATNEVEVTGKYYSNLSGEATVENPSETIKKGVYMPKIVNEYSERSGTTKRMTLTPDEIRRLNQKKEIIFMKSQRPLICDKYDKSLHPMMDEVIMVRPDEHVPIYRQREQAEPRQKTTTQTSGAQFAGTISGF